MRKWSNRELWPRAVASTEDDYAKVLALLSSSDVMHRVSHHEYLAPALLATQNERLDARAFSHPEGAVWKQVQVARLPDGFFSKLLVRCRRNYSHMDFSLTTAALYARGHKAQIFLAHGPATKQLPMNK